MLASRHGAAVALRSARGAAIARVTPRALSGKPPEAVEEDDHEEIEQAMATIRQFNETPVSERVPQSDKFLDTEPVENPLDVLSLDPLPPDQVGRKVMIYQPCKSATTSGTNGLHNWRLRFKHQERWSNPLMGWTSTADCMSNMELVFENAEQAVNYCKKRGYNYEVKTPQKVKVVQGAFKYSHNFLPRNVERELEVNGTKTKHFEFPTAGASHYERPLSFHGTSVARQHGSPEN